ncbi:MAG TPA: DUF4873 domain-containing protein [Aeromicrobium sp.]|nr:DUF4873 domain-containing protein [Aeromicrobium sp.]
MAWSPPEEPTGFSGRATLTVGDQVVDVTVHVDGHLEPLDGRYHWYGRIERSAAVAAIKDAGATFGVLSIDGAATAELRLAEYDPWGHVQVNGVGAPPYPMEPVEIDLPAVRS